MAQVVDFGGVRRAVEVFKEQGYGAGFGVGDGAEAVVGPVVQPVGAGVGGKVQVMEAVLGG